MPFAYRRKDSPNWWIRYRIPGIGLRSEPCPETITTKEQAVARAERLALEAREHNTPAPRLLRHNVTILDAALDHQATRREIASRPRDAARHRRELDVFIAFSGRERLRDLTVSHVTDWIDDLRRRGWTYDSRRHAILWIRRACARAPAYGLPNVIAGQRLDQRAMTEDTEPPRVLQLAEMLARIRALIDDPDADPRIPAGVALMGLCGLRPSELIRLDVSHINPERRLLSVGVTTAKNAASRRTLPIARFALAACRPLLDLRSVGPLFVYGRHAGERRMDTFKCAHIFSAALGLPPKNLRKSFATACTWELGIEPRIVDAYMGHQVHGLSAVTSRHYLGAATVKALLQIPDAIDTAASASP